VIICQKGRFIFADLRQVYNVFDILLLMLLETY